MSKKNVTLATLTAALTVTGMLTLSACTASPTPASPSSSSLDTNTAVPSTATGTAPTLASELQYLIEEEKLAFDVYTVLYGLWGSQTFSNILQSEGNHQSQVLGVMKTYDVSDPRSTEIGVFENVDLQNLYNALIAQGKLSQLDAYKVGVTIEETDIADLKKMLATNPAADVTAMMNSLLSGSQSHLAAFSRKL